MPKVIRSGRTPSTPYQPYPRGTETGHDLVGDEERAVLAAEPGESGVEPLAGRDDAHVARGGLGDDARDLAGVGGEGGGDGVEVVVGQHDGVAGLGAGDAGGVRKREGGEPGAGRGEQRVDVAVVAPGELDHLGAAGEAPGEPDRGHGRLGPGGDEADLLDRLDPGDDLLGERHLALTGRPEGGAAGHGLLDGGDDLGVGMAEDHRPPRADEVDVLPAVGVGEVRTRTGHHEPGRTAHRAESAYGRVHAAGCHGGRTVEERLRNWGFVLIGHTSHGVRAFEVPADRCSADVSLHVGGGGQ